jgi:hypothetical protein
MKTKTKKANRLSERFVLVHFSSHGWTGRKMDRSLAGETARQQNAAADVVDLVINLAPAKELQPIKTARSQAYREFCRLTIPWMGGAVRLLAGDMIMEWRKAMHKAKRKYEQAVAEFLARWSKIINDKQFRKRLGKLATRYHLPTTAELRNRFAIELDMYAVPEVTDFRVKLTQLADDEVDEIRQEVANSLEGLADRAMREVWTQLGTFVERIADTMSKPNKGFHDTLFTNLRNFCEMLPKYNVTNDAALEQARQTALTTLANLDPMDLKEIPNHRRKAAKSAKDLADKIAQYTK